MALNTSLRALQGCGNEQSAIEGWPRPACMAAQALRTGWLGGADEPLIFNVDASANASGIRARLWSVYDRIQNQVRILSCWFTCLSCIHSPGDLM